jgi:DNA-binding ferritin-like protein
MAQRKRVGLITQRSEDRNLLSLTFFTTLIIMRQTKQHKRVSHKRTAKRRSAPNKIVQQFFQFMLYIKLFHWNTKRFSVHKSSDELYAKINEHMDTFTEQMLGDAKHDRQIRLSSIHIPQTKSVQTVLQNFEQFMRSLKIDSNLANIRDEIIGDIQQFKYLHTLA